MSVRLPLSLVFLLDSFKSEFEGVINLFQDD